MNIINELKLFAKDLDILLVEDDLDLNSELVQLLEVFFRKVDFAINGEEAFVKYKNSKYDIVFTDITMPKMDGIQLCKEIKKINENQDILILSAHAEVEPLIELINMNINQFTSKPFNEGQIFYKLLKMSESIVYRKNYKKTETLNFKVLNTKDFFNKLNKNLLLDEKIDDFILELIELDKKFDNQIKDLYLNKVNEKFILNVIKIVNEISKKFLLIEELNNFSHVLNKLSNFLNSLNLSLLNRTQMNNLKILEFVYDDISRFIHTVFVYKDSIDINYLEDSLKTSIEQIERNLLEEEIVEEELEFFNN